MNSIKTVVDLFDPKMLERISNCATEKHLEDIINEDLTSIQVTEDLSDILFIWLMNLHLRKINLSQIKDNIENRVCMFEKYKINNIQKD